MALQAISNHDDLRSEHRHASLLGWEVRSRHEDRRLGRVDDVLVDDNGYTRYLDVNLEHRDDHVLLPSGQAEADRERKVLWTGGLGRDAFDRLPSYDHDPRSVDADYERELMTAYDRSYSNDRYYERPEYRSRHWRERTEGGMESSTRRSGTTAGTTTAASATNSRSTAASTSTASRSTTDRTASGSTERTGSVPVRVDELDHLKVASHDPDPRGWDVIGWDGNRLGRVEHLLADGDAMSVRYLEVSADRSLTDRDDHRVLVPVGHVDLDSSDHRVRVDALDQERLLTLPRFENGRLDRQHEHELLRVFDSGYGSDRRHRHPRFRDEGLGATSTRTASAGTDTRRSTASRTEPSEGPRAERRAAGMASGSSATAGAGRTGQAASTERTSGAARAVPGRDDEAIRENRDARRRDERGSSTRQS